MLRYLDNWKRHSRLQKISRIAPLRRMFMTWKEEVEESKAVSGFFFRGFACLSIL